jgi:hypothetical protein
VALQMSVLMSFEEPIHSLNSVQFSSVQLSCYYYFFIFLLV